MEQQPYCVEEDWPYRREKRNGIVSANGIANGHQGSTTSTSLWIGHDGEQDITNLLFNVKC